MFHLERASFLNWLVSNPWFQLFLTFVLLFTLNSCQSESIGQKRHAAAKAERSTARKSAPTTGYEIYGPPVLRANLADPQITESSGLVASRTTPGIYWTHNDSGDGPFIYAFDEHGVARGTWRVTGASARDWEDIAAGPGPEAGVSYLYIGDTGDTGTPRAEVTVYLVKEPTVKATDASSTKLKPLATDEALAIHLKYPDGAHDAEAVLVHPASGDIYIVSKVPFANPVVYKAAAPLKTQSTNSLTRLTELNIPSMFGGLITGGDISPDGSRLALCDYVDGYELVLPSPQSPFDEIWKQPLKPLDLGRRKQGESIAYRLDGRALLATSEGIHSPLFEVVRR